ncbi:hypothetical protein GCM10027277_23380 [Pseudoduganella ginsengisoli]
MCRRHHLIDKRHARLSTRAAIVDCRRHPAIAIITSIDTQPLGGRSTIILRISVARIIAAHIRLDVFIASVIHPLRRRTQIIGAGGIA